MTTIHEIPGKVTVEWDSSVRAIIEHWANLSLIPLAEFRTAVLDKGLQHAAANQGNAYIVDHSAAKGAFIRDIQEFIETQVNPAFAKAGIKYFLSVPSKDSPLANMAAKRYQGRLDRSGIQHVDVSSVVEAVAWLRTNAC
jgi:hypothetical protein